MEKEKYNIILLGEGTVGKTSIISNLVGTGFSENTIKTVGIDAVNKDVEINKKEYSFRIYDTAGQERYKSMAQRTIKLGHGFLLVFAINNSSSFEMLKSWISSIEDIVKISEKIIFIVGNKIDVKDRCVSKEEAEQFAKNKNFKYFETSAKTKVGIEETFNELYNDIVELNEKKKENYNDKNKLNENAKKEKIENDEELFRQESFQINKETINNNKNQEKKKNWFLRHCMII